MDTAFDLLKSIDSEATVLVAGERAYTGKRFVDTVYKTGNYLRQCGVHGESVVEIAAVPEPETIFALLGTALLEGTVVFGLGNADSPDVRLGPTEALASVSTPVGCKAIGFGEPPDDPTWAYFEREIWSENPFFPETEVDPDSWFLTDGDDSHSFVALLENADPVRQKVTAGDDVAIRAPIGAATTISTGIIAPLQTGATILLPEEGQRGSIAIGDKDSPEERVLEPPDFSTN